MTQVIQTYPAIPRRQYAWLAVPFFLMLIPCLWIADLKGFFDPPLLLVLLNLVFSTLTSLFIAFLVGRSFLAHSSPGLLLLACGALIWGCAGSLALIIGRNDANLLITIHNSCVWLSAFCHFTGVLYSLRSGRQTISMPGLWLALCSFFSVGLAALIAVLASAHLFPVFFIQGQGGTLPRHLALGSTVAMFAFTALFLRISNRRPLPPFINWYSMALGLISIGLFGVMLGPVLGGALNWAGRAAQYAGGIYMLIAAFASMRESRVWRISLEEELAENKERYVALVDLCPDAILVHAEGKFIFANPAAARLFGGPAKTIIGREVLSMIPWEEKETTARRIQEIYSRNEPMPFRETRILRFDGTSLDVEVSGVRVLFDGKPAIQVVLRDNTERKKTEAALYQAMHRFELLAQTASELLQATDPQKIVESLCTKVMTKLDCHAFFNFLVDEKTGRLRLNACAGIPQEEAKRIEWLDFGTAVCGCAAKEGCRIVAEHIPSTPDKRTELVKSYGIKAYACHPLLGPGGRVLGTLSFGTKTSETFSPEDLSLMKAVSSQVATAMVRMQSEKGLRESEEKLHLQAAALLTTNRELEAFSYSVAHDLRNPLNIIITCIEVLYADESLEFHNDTKEALSHITHSAERMAQVINDLLTLSNISRREFQLQDLKLDQLAFSFCEELKKTSPQRSVHFDVQPGLETRADSGLMRILLQNLLRNAWKFTSTKESARIALGKLDNNGQSYFFVRDNGVGFDMSQVHRLFKPYERLHTQNEFKGSGIGLAIAKRIVDRHGGEIWAEGEKDKGATIYFQLP